MNKEIPSNEKEQNTTGLVDGLLTPDVADLLDEDMIVKEVGKSLEDTDLYKKITQMKEHGYKYAIFTNKYEEIKEKELVKNLLKRMKEGTIDKKTYEELDSMFKYGEGRDLSHMNKKQKIRKKLKDIANGNRNEYKK